MPRRYHHQHRPASWNVTNETVSISEDNSAVNKSTAAAMMDMAEAAWHVGDTDLALQLLEEEARCRRELFDTSLAAAKQDVMEFIAAVHKRITSAAAGDLQRLIESELAARADVVQAVEQAAGLLHQHMTATLGVLQQLSAGTARLDDIEKLRQLFIEEAAARRALFDDAVGALVRDAATLGRDAAMAFIQAKMKSEITTIENCEAAEGPAREAIEREEWAMFLTVQKGFETAKRAQALADWAKQYVHRWLGHTPEPTTLAECHEYEGENRSLLERRAMRTLGLLRQFDVPPDDSSRSLVLDETERYLGHLASVAITTFVDALAQPAAVLAVMKDRYRAEGPEAVRVGRQLLCDLAVHGPPTALEEQWASARAKAAALPTLCGLSAAQAASMQLLSAAAWDAACAKTHERVQDEAHPCMPCCVM
jgi:hypothetical protein